MQLAPQITEGALAESDPLAMEAVDLFLAILGAEAGYMGLRCLASGGVYVCGGIIPRVRSGLPDAAWGPACSAAAADPAGRVGMRPRALRCAVLDPVLCEGPASLHPCCTAAAEQPLLEHVRVSAAQRPLVAH